MTDLIITRAALHELLDEAHTAIIEHRHAWAGAVLHTLRKLTAPETSVPQGRARRLVEPPPEPFHAPTLSAEEAQPAHQQHERSQARARSKTPNTGRAGGVWTAERVALLKRLWAEGATAAEILLRLNEVPAPSPVASEQAVWTRGNYMRLKRPPEVAARLMQRAGRMGAERAAELAAAGVASLGAKPLVWTAERLAEGKRLWEAGESAATMLDALNRLPATAPIGSAHTIMTQAAKQKWQRPPEFLAAKLARYAERMRDRRAKAAPAADTAEAPPQPEPPATAPLARPAPPAPITTTPADEKAEVFDAFAAGQSVRAVAEDFGLPLTMLSNWHAEWKVAQERQGADA